jgi:D-alanine-D-alanine ligase
MRSVQKQRPSGPQNEPLQQVAAGDLRELQARIACLTSRMRLAVVFGGNKSDTGSVLYQSPNTRSWKSYEAVATDIAEALKRIGFRHVHLLPDDMMLGDRLRREGIHMAWLNSGGVQGYNSTAHAPAMLEMFGIPYVGHDPLAATTLDNKHAFKREATCAGLPTAAFSTWTMTRGPFRPEMNSRFLRAFGDYKGPFVVKPVSGRASLHVHFVADTASLSDAVAEVYAATENEVLIEKYVAGREYCIAVAGPVTARGGRLSRRRDPFTFSALERVLDANEKIFTSMDVRPITTERFKCLDPIRDSELEARLHRLACEVFREFNLRSVVRLDVRSDERDNLYILEANPKPDLKQPGEGVTSLISAGLPQLGMSYDDLIFSLLADRLDFLFTHRRDTVKHIVDLTGGRASAADAQLSAEQIDRLNAMVADANVAALQGTIDAARATEPHGTFGQASLRVNALPNPNTRLAEEVKRASKPGRARI